MKQFIFFCLFSIQSLAIAYVGSNSTEATITFDAFIEVNRTERPKAPEIQEILRDHEEYMFGPMSTNAVMAAPKGDGTFKVLHVSRVQDRYRIDYTYRGTIVLQNGPRTHYNVVLPNDPVRIFEKTSTHGKVNPCTDKEHPEKENFSYFWSPDLPGCNLIISEGEDYQSIDAAVERIPNTEHTRPDYERLPDDDGNIHISLLMGMDDSSKGKDPLESGHNKKNDDINAKAYRTIRRELLEMGFTVRRWTNEEIREVVLVDTRPLPFVEEFTQEYNEERAGRISITLFFGKSDVSEPSLAFNFFFKRAVETSAITIYDGHSGMGTNLVIPVLERRMGVKFHIPRNRYQILYVNSCSSYAYYNKSFFERKDKNLNIITAGMATPFDGGAETDLSLIGAAHNWAYRGTMIGFKELLRRLENDNLAGVNGDEHNPTTIQ